MNDTKNNRLNLPLLIFDLLFLPIHIIRAILIYFYGSKYNLKGFQFLDVIMHADKPYFNQENCCLIDTIGKDYRVVIRDDSRLFPLDINKYIKIENENKNNNKVCETNDNYVLVGTTVPKNPNVWTATSEDFENNNTKYIKNKRYKNHSKLSSNNEIESLSDSNETDNESVEINTNNLMDTDDSEDTNDVSSFNYSKTKDNNEFNFEEESTNRSEIIGVNYFDSNDVTTNKKNKKRKDILDSIREELNSAFE
jgi:hypothetical protein